MYTAPVDEGVFKRTRAARHWYTHMEMTNGVNKGLYRFSSYTTYMHTSPTFALILNTTKIGSGERTDSALISRLRPKANVVNAKHNMINDLARARYYTKRSRAKSSTCLVSYYKRQFHFQKPIFRSTHYTCIAASIFFANFLLSSYVTFSTQFGASFNFLHFNFFVAKSYRNVEKKTTFPNRVRPFVGSRNCTAREKYIK